MHSQVQAAILALLNHGFFKTFEPEGFAVVASIAALILQPLLLSLYAHTATPSSILNTYLIFFTVLPLSIVLYRLSPFHPLAKIPGPWIFKVSKFWLVYIRLTGRHHLVYKELHDKYGPFVRIGPNDMSVIEADAVNTVLTHGGLEKGQFYRVHQLPGDQSHPLSLIKGDIHRNRRRLWSRGLSQEALCNYDDNLAHKVRQLVSGLEKGQKGSHGVNIVEWLQFFTFDFMTEMAYEVLLIRDNRSVLIHGRFGREFGMLNQGIDDNGIWQVMGRFAVIVSTCCHVPWADYLVHRSPLAVSDMGELSEQFAQTRLADSAKMKDLWYHLTDQAGLENSKPAYEDTVADARVAILAGADTTVTSLAAFFYYMIRHPKEFALLREEIDRVYPSGSDATNVSKQSELVYASACLNESLRLLPSIPTVGPREVPKGGGPRILAGHLLPEGTQVWTPPYAIHRSPDNFYPRPDDFVPSRWISSDENKSQVMQRAAFIPFFRGPHSCVGKALALREMLMVIACVVQSLDIKFADGFDPDTWPEKIRDFYLTDVPPLKLNVQPRS
ncbi:hypothetical protein D9757_010825 [Collybiopsis confluens]|uniref:Cytochrome P450 n=1 Tax=Collybiopsis confluens TaxID=2823264 RepID=A0A8H5LRP3_9AGAR|nr:hypothetical protein D9757_010825 [Collybiopsis confluens]